MVNGTVREALVSMENSLRRFSEGKIDWERVIHNVSWGCIASVGLAVHEHSADSTHGLDGLEDLLKKRSGLEMVEGANHNAEVTCRELRQK